MVPEGLLFPLLGDRQEEPARVQDLSEKVGEIVELHETLSKTKHQQLEGMVQAL